MAADQAIVSVPLDQLCVYCRAAFEDRPTAAPGVYLLPLTGRRNGQNGHIVAWAKVRDDDFARTILPQSSWHLRTGYAKKVEWSSTVGGKRRKGTIITLHRLMYEHYSGPIPDGLVIDHINRDRLDNRPENLRAVTHLTNAFNRTLGRNNTSGFRCVWRIAKCTLRPWGARVQLGGRYVLVKNFATAREAADAVNECYQKHFPGTPVPNP